MDPAHFVVLDEPRRRPPSAVVEEIQPDSDSAEYPAAEYADTADDVDDVDEDFLDMHSVLDAVSELAGLYLATEEGETLVDVIQGGLAGIQASLDKHNKLLYRLLLRLEAKTA